ncbi:MULTISPECIES: MBL fold metallo-hydrolase [Shewanella]|uniref:MBL fold metallo-hydrolase n=1 Tax=Shewanella TaxID=22 RepID=UPI001EFEAB84|nr:MULTISPECIES: MBL fold metallo-hydrolase [Shewanella]MCG9746263.1 FprA family A-type flavoprotein [Shewanella sp. Isolate8]MCL2912040.1 FprA family A-type flavoprotein [Shewanella aquimarina]
MKSELIIETPTHKWLYFGRDPEKPDKIIDTNQYMVVSSHHALLMDPGGIELFAAMLANIVKHIPLSQLTHLFASHQDPDIISSLGLWDQTLPKAKLYSPWLWEGFIRHFGMNNISYEPIADNGGSVSLDQVELQFIPAHYLHASGNFHVYDPVTKVLMSGDIGAALEDPQADIYVDDFEQHCAKMAYFHQRWMPSNRAKNDWIKRVRKLDIQYLCPQHGRIFRGPQVKQFLDWFESLNVGVGV